MTREHRQGIPQTCSQEGRSWHCHFRVAGIQRKQLPVRAEDQRLSFILRCLLPLWPCTLGCLECPTVPVPWSALPMHSMPMPYNHLPLHRPLHVPQPLASAQQQIQFSTTLQHLVLGFSIPSRLKSHVIHNISCHRSVQVTSQHCS